MKKVIAIVGTSLFENYMKHKPNSIDDAYSDLKEKLHEEWNKKCKDIKSIKNSVSPWAKSDEKASAEIRSLLKIKQDVVGGEIEVYLLATDTVLSRLAAEIIAERFKDDKLIHVHFDPAPKDPKDNDVISGLQIWDKKEFEEEGLKNLFERLDSISKECQKEDVILNITGGYKGVIPYLTIFAQLKEFRTFYIFEDSQELIEIPQLPVDFDFSVVEENYIAFEGLNKQKQNLPSIVDFKKNLHEKEKEAEKEYEQLEKKRLIQVNDGKVEFSVIGRLLFGKYEDLYNRGVWHRQNLLSKLVELKVYEYYVDKYGSEKVKIEPGKKVGDSNFDIDLYIEKENEIEAIEIKPGGNPPILNSPMKKDKPQDTIEYKLTKGGFNWLLENNKGKQVVFKVILYSHKDIHSKNKEKIEKLHRTNQERTENLSWYLLKLDIDYKKKTDWKVSNRLELIGV